MSTFDPSQLQGGFEMRFPARPGEAWTQEAADSMIGQVTWFNADEFDVTVRWRMRVTSARLESGALVVAFEPVEVSNQESRPE